MQTYRNATLYPSLSFSFFYSFSFSFSDVKIILNALDTNLHWIILTHTSSLSSSSSSSFTHFLNPVYVMIDSYTKSSLFAAHACNINCILLPFFFINTISTVSYFCCGPSTIYISSSGFNFLQLTCFSPQYNMTISIFLTIAVMATSLNLILIPSYSATIPEQLLIPDRNTTIATAQNTSVQILLSEDESFSWQFVSYTNDTRLLVILSTLFNTTVVWIANRDHPVDDNQ